MNASITGTIESSTGGIDLFYDDLLSTVGAQFTCSVGTGSISYISFGSGGMSKIGGIISSTDYDTATNKYTLDMSTGTGSIDVLGRSY